MLWGFSFRKQKMQVQVFNFDNHTVRTQTDNNGEPWFNANDVCDSLGYSNSRDAIAKHVDVDDVAKRDAIDSLGRTQSSNHVNESGMYALVFGSTLPDAKKFKRWVTSEVLPTIRKTGKYESMQDKPAIPATQVFTEFFQVACLIGLDKNAAAIGANQAANQLTGTNVLQLLGHTHMIAEKQKLIYTPTELGAQFLGAISARKVNLLLAEAGLQTKEGEHWTPTPKSEGLYRLLDTGKKSGTGTSVLQCKWFQDVIALLQPYQD
jgi:prophage antirepressor-like protein